MGLQAAAVAPKSTNIIENMMGTVRRVCRNVKRWRTALMGARRQASCRPFLGLDRGGAL
jgi:hypothetical protein